MSGDYTRFTFEPRNDYSGVLKQQGRVDLDADFNECLDIVDRRWRSETIDIMGHCIVPMSTPDAFLVTPTAIGAFDIGIGRMYVDGIQVENHGLPPLEYVADLGELRGTLPVPYSDQPYLPAPLPEPLAANPGTNDLVYLDVWQREVTVLEDPTLREIALGGPDTTTRIQSAWQVRVLQNVGPADCEDTIEAWNDLVAPSAGRLTTSAVAPPVSDDPCIVSPSGGFRGLENRLYRVEIHSTGPIGGGAPAKFKWSRNNASVASEVTAIPSATQVAVQQVGKDRVLRFDVGTWIEVTDDLREFESQPGHMAQITAIDEANRVLTFAPAIPGTINFDATDPSRHTRVKRWDQTIGVDANGLLDVIAVPIDIEDGVRVEFTLDPPAGNFRVGDYWAFAARTADGSVEVLTEAPPRGILHHYCRLGFIHWGANIDTTTFTDCRDHWPDCECGGLCTVTVGDGVDSQGQFTDIQQAIDSLGNRGGVVCIGRGFYLLRDGLQLDGTKRNVILRGMGPATRIVFVPQPVTGGPPPGGALLSIIRTDHVRVEDLYMAAVGADSIIHIIESHFCRIEGCTLVNVPPRDNSTPPPRRGIQLVGAPSHIEVVNNKLLAQKGVASSEGRVTELLFKENRVLTTQVGVALRLCQGVEILHNQFRGLPPGALAQDLVQTRSGMDTFQMQVAALFQAAPNTQNFSAAGVIILSGNRVIIDANLITAQVGVFGFLLFNARIHHNDLLCLIAVMNVFSIRFKFEDNFVFGLLAGVLHAGIFADLDYTSNEFLGLNGIIWMSAAELQASFKPIMGGALGSVGFGTAGPAAIDNQFTAGQSAVGAVAGFGMLLIAKVHRNVFLTFTRGIYKTDPILSADVSIIDNTFSLCSRAGIELGGRGRGLGDALLSLLVRIVTLRHLISANSLVTRGPAVVSSAVFTEVDGNTITCVETGVDLNARSSVVRNNQILGLPAEAGSTEGLIVLSRLCSGSVVSGNILRNSRGHSILLGEDITDIVIADNVISGARRSGIGTRRDVVFVGRAQILRNTVEFCRGEVNAGTTEFGGAIVIGAGNNVRVMGNVVRSNSPLPLGSQFVRWCAIYLEDVAGVEVSDNRVTENAAIGGLNVSAAVGLQGTFGGIRVQNNTIAGNGGAALAIGESRQDIEGVQQALVENNQMSSGVNQNFQLVFVDRMDFLIFSGNQCFRTVQSPGLPAVELLRATRGNVCCNQVDTPDRNGLNLSGAELVVNANTVRATSTSSIIVTGFNVAGVAARVIVTSNLSNGLTINVGGPLVRQANIPA
jgi:hypothetical protein